MGDQDGGLRYKVFKPEHCSPGADISDGSCLDRPLMIKLAKILNKDAIDKIDCSLPTSKLHELLCVKLKEITGCSSESCWLNVKSIMSRLGKDKKKFEESFKPIMPKEWIKDYNVWLTTDEIEKCLDQHENCDNSFYFYGAVPIDFSNCSVSNLCSFNLKQHIKEGNKKIGIVFNTDPHTKDGEHWISMYVDIFGENLNGIPGIYYFDSYGDKPCKKIKELIDKIKKQGKKSEIDFKYLYNDHEYQKKDAQCGMYSIHFIKEMLTGIPFEKFLKSDLSDKKMILKRDKYFIRED